MMGLSFEIWSVVIGLMELGCALTWNHDEQFVEGDFPYFPYANADAGDGDGLTDARLRSNQFSGFKTWSRKPLYAFYKDSNKLIDATKAETEESALDSVDPDKSGSAEIDAAEIKKTISEGPRKQGLELQKRGLTGSVKLKANKMNRNDKKITQGNKVVPSFLINENRPRRSLRHKARLALKYPSRESISLADIWAHGISRNDTPVIIAPSDGKKKFTRDSKANKNGKTLMLVSPYETNYNESGLRSMSPSTWLAKEIEKFIKRKDHRWLDFMKNTGMDVRKYSGIASETKHKSDKTNLKKTSCNSCLQSRAVPDQDEPAKIKTDLLISRIDSLLADLNTFRSSVKNGWPDSSFKRTRNSEMGLKLMTDNAVDRGKSRRRRRARSRGMQTCIRPPNQRPTTGTDVLEDDLRDLRKNLASCQDGLSDDEMKALDKLKLHVKVYVEKESSNQKTACQAVGIETEHYE